MQKLLTSVFVILILGLLGGIGYTIFNSYISPYNLTTTITDIAPTLEADRGGEDTKEELPRKTRVTGVSVTISSKGNMGSGAVLSDTLVITVAHVIEDQAIVFVDAGTMYERWWVPARVVGRIKATGEDIILLQLLNGVKFKNKENFKVGTGIKLPRYVITPMGCFDFNPGTIIPGDSGGAILNIDGELIGLVTGYRVPSKQGVVTLFK